MTPAFMPADDAAARAARLDAAALDLAGLHGDPSLDPYRVTAVGAERPFMPLPASLAAAASTLDQVARCLRHRADSLSTPSIEGVP